LARNNATYNQLPPLFTTPLSPVYQEDGFQIDIAAGQGIYGYAVWGTQASQYPGSTALFDVNDLFNVPSSPGPNGQGSPVATRLTKLGIPGPLLPRFTLLSIDLADLNNTGIAVTANFVGLKPNGSQVRQSFTTDTLRGLQTFTFSNDFTDLVNVTWGQVGGFSPGFQVDNICLDSGCPTGSTSVPEPLTVLGTIFGAGYGVALKRKLAKAQADKQGIS
jgi:hypothetical protein